MKFTIERIISGKSGKIIEKEHFFRQINLKKTGRIIYYF